MSHQNGSGGIHPAPREFSQTQLQEDAILRYFHYRHLPPLLQEVSAPFCGLAYMIVTTLPRNPERTVALRKLLEAKDAAVRANVPAAAHKETFLDRMHKERADLLSRIEKLNVFIDTLQFFSLPERQQELMREQRGAMQTYCDALTQRLKLVEDVQPEHIRRDHDQHEGEREPVTVGEHHDRPPPFDG